MQFSSMMLFKTAVTGSVKGGLGINEVGAAESVTAASFI